ncbi:MAG: beta-hexosaminidase [Bacilli bacterium]|nr:beta-hexosaminidase [Bacilli bacterium]
MKKIYIFCSITFVLLIMFLINNQKSSNDLNEIVFNESIPKEWLDNGIFKDYYNLAYNKLQELSLDEKIGQLFLVRYPESNQVAIQQTYNFAGYVFYAKDFANKNFEQVTEMIETLQNNSKITLLTAVDEEGGKVVRISSNPSLIAEPFKASSELYEIGGFEKIRADTIVKSKFLFKFGLNLNLAPVVDVATNKNDYMYNRTIKKDTVVTSNYAKTVIEASKNTGVSYTLKHFPGYGNNKDTHIGFSIDDRTYDELLKNDLPPFAAGIAAGAEAIMISHNIVSAIDKEKPASISNNINKLLREDLSFTGIIITDDISMSALNNIENVTLKSFLAGNNLIITTDYEKSFNEIKKALEINKIKENAIDENVFKVLAWKYYKGLIK